MIPTRVDQLTDEWLTNALREAGALRESRVIDVESEVLSDGKGFMGQVVRLHLRLDRPENGAPETLIAKLPTDVGSNRAIGELMGAYEREIFFYGDLAQRVAVRTPRAYYSEMDEVRGISKRDAEGAAILDRWPMWMIRWMMRFVTWIASRRTRHYVLLIEDVAPARVGDQVAGCTAEEARNVLLDVARLHAQHWRSPDLEKSPWLRRLDLNPRTMHSIYLKNLPGFLQRFRSRLPEGFEPSLRWLEARGVDIQRAFHGAAPETLLHCDLRLDNISFSPNEAERTSPVTFLDWQLTGRGPAVYDVAYFLSGALVPDVEEEVVLDLVRAYHGELLAHGVRDYPLESCLLDYRRALLTVLHRVSSTDTMEFGDDRGEDLIVHWVERTLARLRGVDYEALLSTPARA